MTRKTLFTSVFLITTISIIDFQFYAEGRTAYNRSAIEKGFMHIIALSAIGWVGYNAYYKNKTSRFRKIWVAVYCSIIAVMAVLGMAHYYFGLFSYARLAAIGMIRPFFTTPLPFLLMYVLQRHMR